MKLTPGAHAPRRQFGIFVAGSAITVQEAGQWNAVSQAIDLIATFRRRAFFGAVAIPLSKRISQKRKAFEFVRNDHSGEHGKYVFE